MGLRLVYFIFLFMWGLKSLSADPYCPPDDPLTSAFEFLKDSRQETKIFHSSRGKLPSNWVNQLTGADLVETNRVARVGLIDTSESNHMDQVEYVYRSSDPQGELSFKLEWEDMENPEVLSRKIQAIKARGKLPRFVGISFEMGNGENVRKSLELLRENNMIVVASSGNIKNSNEDGEVDFNNSLPGIINIGSIGSNGLTDIYSKRSSFLAPTGNELYTNVQGKELLLGGTSYAQPQILAAFGQVDAYLPGISEAEIRALMNYTALQGPDGQALNHFKIVEVAKKFAKHWPHSRAEIFNSKSDNYDFSEEVESLISRGDFRRAYFLDPSRDDIRLRLIEEYEAKGFNAMAQYFKAFSKDRNEQLAYVRDLARDSDPRIRQQAQRSLTLMNDSDSVLHALVAGSSGLYRRETLSNLAKVTRSEMSQNLKLALFAATKDSDSQTHSLAWQVVAAQSENLGGLIRQEDWRAAFESLDASKRHAALVVASRAPFKDVPFTDFSKDPDWAVRHQALHYIQIHSPVAADPRDYLLDEEDLIQNSAIDGVFSRYPEDPFLAYLREAKKMKASERKRTLIERYYQLNQYSKQEPTDKMRAHILNSLALNPWLEFWRASSTSLRQLGDSQNRIEREFQRRMREYSLNLSLQAAISSE